MPFRDFFDEAPAPIGAPAAPAAGGSKFRDFFGADPSPASFGDRFGETPYLDYNPTAVKAGQAPGVVIDESVKELPEEGGGNLVAAALRRAGQDARTRGEAQIRAPEEEFPNTPEAKGLPLEWALGAFLTMNPQAQMDIVRANMPGAEFKKDSYGNPMLRRPGRTEWEYFNKAGPSLMDIPSFPSEVLKYIPAGKFASLGRNMAQRAVTAILGTGVTDMGAQEAAKLLGSEQDYDPAESTVTALAGGAGQVVGDVVTKSAGALGRRMRGEVRTTSQDLKDLATPVFQKANSLGIRIGPEGVDQEIANLRLLAAGKSALPHAMLDPTTGLIKDVGKASRRYLETNGVLDDISANAGTQRTLEDLWQIREALSDAQWLAHGKDHHVARELLDHFDDYMDNHILPSDILAGDPAQGIALQRQATEIWHRAMKTSAIERAIADAMVAANPNKAVALRNEFRKFVRAPDFRRRWTPYEQQLLREAARPNGGQRVVEVLGMFAPRNIVSTAGSYLLVGPGAWVAGELGQAASTAMAGARASRLQDAVASGTANRAKLDITGRAPVIAPALAAGEGERRYTTRERFAAGGGVQKMAGGGTPYDYLLQTANPGGTMGRQGPRLAIGRLHPSFAQRLEAAIRQARAEGIPAAVSSSYRPPIFGVGGYRDKYLSLHSYGLATDIAGIGRPGSKTARRWFEIATSNGLFNPYGPNNHAEWNHYQAVPEKGETYTARHPALRQSITARGPKSLEEMWAASGVPLGDVPASTRAFLAQASPAGGVQAANALAAGNLPPITPGQRIMENAQRPAPTMLDRAPRSPVLGTPVADTWPAPIDPTKPANYLSLPDSRVPDWVDQPAMLAADLADSPSPMAYAEDGAQAGLSAPAKPALPDWSNDLGLSDMHLYEDGPGGYPHVRGMRGGQDFSAYRTNSGRVWEMPAGPPSNNEYSGAPAGYYSFNPDDEPPPRLGGGFLSRLFGRN